VPETLKIQLIAVVIPAYKVKSHILGVINEITSVVDKIYVVDDACPEKSGEFVQNTCQDARVSVLFRSENGGVGAAVMDGYKTALEDGASIVVKVDGDGQMDPKLIPNIIAPILDGYADYTKGNRFFDLEEIKNMPKIRLFGNAVLSFLTKISTGYWNIFDPTNGYTAIHSAVLGRLPLAKISKRYFFESDILFRLNLLRAVVVDVPMAAKYGDEKSNLKIHKVLFTFLVKHCCNFLKRLFYNYYLRDMSVASIELPIGLILVFFGIIFGSYKWVEAVNIGTSAPPGVVMLSALPLLMGLQLILAFFAYDIASVPKYTWYKRISWTA
jgi:glycosyltransferase involved in cell wall biosynthesis